MPTTVAFDTAVDGGGFLGSTSRSFSVTVGSGSNRILYALINFWNSGGTVSSCTYGGVALTRALQSGLSGSNDRVEVWRLKNPTVGSATLLVNFSAAADGEVSAISLNTVDQTT